MAAAVAIQVWLDTYALEGVRRVFSDHVFSELSPASFEARIRSREECVFVAEQRQHIIGVAVARTPCPCPCAAAPAEAPGAGPDKEPDARAASSALNIELDKLYVQRSARRRGVGQGLLRAVEEWHPKFDVAGPDAVGAGVWLAVWEHNRGAIDFYRRCGYQELGSVDIPLGAETHRNLIFGRSSAPRPNQP